MWTITYIPNEIFDSNEITYSVNENIVFIQIMKILIITQKIFTHTLKYTNQSCCSKCRCLYVPKTIVIYLNYFIYDINDQTEDLYDILIVSGPENGSITILNKKIYKS